MRLHSPFMFDRFVIVVALLVLLIGGAVQVTPARAAGIVVNSNADTRANDGKCTLREAIIAANTDARSGTRSGECVAGGTGTDSLTFAGNYTITLGSQLPNVTAAMTITGKGAANTIIQAAASPNVAHWRLFQVTSLGALTLEGVTVRNGRCNGSSTLACTDGGGIYNDYGGTLVVSNSMIAGNSSIASGGGFYNTAGNGGGVYNAGTMTVTNSLITDNHSVGGIYGYGGGIDNQGTLTVTDSTFSGNTARKGGSINVRNNGYMIVSNSTFLGNSADDVAGAISNYGILTVGNSTFSANTAYDGGGAIFVIAGSVTVLNSTFSGNTAADSGGIGNMGIVTLKNTIIANNISTAADTPNCSNPGGIIDEGNNVESWHSCGFDSNNGSMSDTDPMLGPLSNNGGPTQTMPLLMGSPAIDHGNPSFCNEAPVNGLDQRGVHRPLGVACDIGAFETSSGRGPDSVGVFRPSNGVLFLKNLNLSGIADLSLNYGLPGDYPVVGDWDGNGTTTIGVYRKGIFYLRNSNTIGFADHSFAFGMPGDEPVAGDWDGDGTDTIGVYRSSTGTFYLRNSNSTGAPEITFSLGIPGDVGIAGDWDGDGLDSTGVFRPSDGALYLKDKNETGFADVQINYGIGGDQPITGDWNDDGIDTIGVYRNGSFYLRNSNTIGFADIVFGLGIPGDHPIAGNWDGLP